MTEVDFHWRTLICAYFFSCCNKQLFTAVGCHICRPVNRDGSGGFPPLQVLQKGPGGCGGGAGGGGGGPQGSVSGPLRLSYRGGAGRSCLPSHEPVFTQARGIYHIFLGPWHRLKIAPMEMGNYQICSNSLQTVPVSLMVIAHYQSPIFCREVLHLIWSQSEPTVFLLSFFFFKFGPMMPPPRSPGTDPRSTYGPRRGASN